jgi:hypothetical protein
MPGILSIEKYQKHLSWSHAFACCAQMLSSYLSSLGSALHVYLEGVQRLKPRTIGTSLKPAFKEETLECWKETVCARKDSLT